MTFAAFWIAFKSIKTMQAAGAFTIKSLMGNRQSPDFAGPLSLLGGHPC